MNNVLHRSLVSLPRVAHRADGVYIYDEQNNAYLDACGGAAVSNIGHNNRFVIDAIKTQLDSLAYAHTAFFTSDTLELLATKLCSLAPGMDKALLLSGGSEANEAALKLARQYYVECGKRDKRLFIARKQSYHGNTLGALAVGGNEWRKEDFRPLLKTAHHIDPCYAYRYQLKDESAEDFGLRMANQLEDKILFLGPENVAGFMAETVVGATMGAVTAAPGYFKRIREICDTYDVLLILDEVMCGAGRCGTMYAYEQEEIIPDMVSTAKGLGGGYQAIGGLLCQNKILEPIQQGSGFFQHGHTYMGHTTAVAGALATIEYLEHERLIDNVHALGEKIQSSLRSRLSEHPNVGEIRGRGLFIALELVADRESKAPFDPGLKVHAKIKKLAMAKGLLCYPMGGTIDGRLGDHVLLAPPFIINDEHINVISSVVSETIEEVTQSIS